MGSVIEGRRFCLRTLRDPCCLLLFFCPGECSSVGIALGRIRAYTPHLQTEDRLCR